MEDQTLIKPLIKLLTPLLTSILNEVRTQFSQLSLSPNTHASHRCRKKTLEAYQSWQAIQLHLPDNPHSEFCLQTAYMQFVRIFFLRACENYHLLPPLTQNEQQTTSLIIAQNYLTQLLQNFYQHADIDFARAFDWFTPGEHTTSSLYHLLKSYNFKELNIDILGRIYNEGFIEHKSRSEKGQFYTPVHIVDYMLDTLGIPPIDSNDYTKHHDFLNKTVGDLSCGSGSFLVAVAARKSALLQQLIAISKIDPQNALHILTSTIIGFDLNPFACFLAKINLLLQCLPFLREEHGRVYRSVERLPVYCADVLDPTSIKQSGIGLQEFDYLLGNPPYVSAHENSSHLRYRNGLRDSGHYHLLHQKWDLFVPFFERNLQLFRPGIGRLGLIVSNAIETEGYADPLRQELCQRYRLLQIDFFPGLRLFQDAAIESTIVFVENSPPNETHPVTRRKHLRAHSRSFESLPHVQQRTTPEQVFRWRYLPALEAILSHESVPLCAIVYIGTGIEAQSSEHSDTIIEGKRQKRFTLHDVFVPLSDSIERPAGYPDDGVLGDDIDRYYLRRRRYLAYDKYLPYMRGPRHIALFRTPEKLLLGETSGGYYDTAGLFANHSVQVVVSWKALEQAGVLQEKGIQRVLRKSQQISGVAGDLPQIAEMFDLRYLLAIINSRFMRNYIASNLHEGTRKGRIYPDVWKRLPVKVASLERQREIALLVEAVQGEYRKLAGLAQIGEQEAQKKIKELLTDLEALVEAVYSEPTKIDER